MESEVREEANSIIVVQPTQKLFHILKFFQKLLGGNEVTMTAKSD